MHLTIRHETRYGYAPPARSALQLLRMTPRSYDGQHVRAWRINSDHDCCLRASEDALGNVTHAFDVEGPISSLSITVEGEVETQDTAGIVHGAVERFPPGLFLRETDLTLPDPEIAAFAAALSRADRLSTLHEITTTLHGRMAFLPGTTLATTTAREAFRLTQGVCQDFAHIFIAAARCLDIPARYVSGYLYRHEEAAVQDAGHAWVEAYVPDLGWIGFDPANGISPTEDYIRLAIGLDYLGAAPIAGSRHGGGDERLEVQVHVEERRPSQTQKQWGATQSQGQRQTARPE